MASVEPVSDAALDRFDPSACAALLATHGACLAVVWTGTSTVALAIAALLFVVRAFGLTAGYHRYFAHRSFRTSRAFQLALALLGASAAQLGPLWWAGHHRRHHRWSDTERDVHSPVVRGFWWGHMGWLVARRWSHSEPALIEDFARYPELRWLDRHHWVAPLGLVGSLVGVGAALEAWAPGLGTSAAQLVVVGFFCSTAVLYHVTFAVNSVGHRFGGQRYETGEGSRNNAWIALISLGDGWHNNHHRFPRAARHGFFWWELDPTWWGLRALAALGLVHDLVPPPAEAYAEPPLRARPTPATARAARPHAAPNASPTRP